MILTNTITIGVGVGFGVGFGDGAGNGIGAYDLRQSIIDRWLQGVMA